MAELIGSFNENNQIIIPPGVTFKPMIKAGMLPKTDTGGATLLGSFNDNAISQYETKLSLQEEQQFQSWKQKYAPNDSGMDYDLRGAFKAGLTPDPQTRHFPDTYKKPNHPTFSNESIYAVGANKAKAGRWEGETYIPQLKENVSSPPISGGVFAPSGNDQDWEKMGKFQKFLDVIGRPGYGVKALINQIQEETARGVPISKPEIKKRFEAFWQGLSGQERITANQLWEQRGVQGIPLLGFVTEIATDPLMYGGYSAVTRGITKVGKETIASVGRQAPKFIGKFPAVEKVVGKAQDILEPAGKLLKGAFVSKSSVPELNNLISKYLNERQYMSGKELHFGVKVNSAIKTIAKKTGKSVDDVNKEIINFIELSPTTPNMPSSVPEVKLLANTLKDRFTNILMAEKQAGLKIGALGQGTEAKIQGIRKEIETLRTQNIEGLTQYKAQLLGRLDDIIAGRQKAAEQVAQKGYSAAQKAVVVDDAKRLKLLIQKNNHIEKQLAYLEKQGLVATEKGLPTGHIQKTIDKLEREYWSLESRISQRIQGLPEFTGDSVIPNRIAERLQKAKSLFEAPPDTGIGIFGKAVEKEIAGVDKTLANVGGVVPGFKQTPKSFDLFKELDILKGKPVFGYFPRVISKQAAGNYLRQAEVGGKKVWSRKLANSLRRKTGDYSLEEFNALVASEGLESLGGKTAEAFFSTNPGYATAVRGIRSAKAVTSAQFLDETGQIFGRSAKVAPQGWVELPEAVTKLNPSLKGKMFDPEVAGEINKVTVNYFNQAPIKDFLKVFDTVQNTWKRWTLAIFPKYHLRNAVGNTWNNYLAGVDPKHYAEAARLQAHPGVNREVIVQAQKHGVLGKGWYSADIEKTIEKQVFGGAKGPTGVGMEVGTVVENNARLAHFMDRLSKGDDAEVAARSVKKYLFDYQDLTAFEKQWMKRIAPFYTWTRKNIPLQLEQLWKQPEKFAVLTPALRDRDSADLLRMKLAQPSLYERLPVEIGRTKEAVSYIALEGLLPPGDLTKLIRPHELLLELASPYIKTPVELIMNKSFYREQNIQKYAGETQEILKLELPVKLQYALANLIPTARLVNEITNYTKKKMEGEELTPGERLFSFALAKVYKMDTTDLKTRALQKIERDITELTIGAQRAKSLGREREFERIMKTIKEVREIVDKVR